MNFEDSPAEAEFRREARSWIGANGPNELRHELERSPYGTTALKGADIIEVSKAWQKKKKLAGWACIDWPVEWGGRGATLIEQVIWREEEAAFQALTIPFIIGTGLAGPTIMTWGTPEQKSRLLPSIASGAEIWCQMFSEPSAGSDLAGIRTRAERSDSGWVVNGQKIWTSGARDADWAILLARTNSDVPKHQGLTMFYLSTKSSGIEIRPIRQITGQSHFNEVFMTDVEIPDTQRLGPAGQGWSVTLTVLMNERLAVGGNMSTGFAELLALACNVQIESGLAIDDRAVRSRLATFAARTSGLRYTTYRNITALSHGQEPGPENSIIKLVAGSMMQEIAMLALDLQGQAGAVMDGGINEDGDLFQMMLLRSPGTRLEGGTDEIMRNIIAERVLKLPPDIRVDKDVPFNKVRAGESKK